MSKSIARKKADKKKKGNSYGATRTRNNGHTRTRQAQPPHPMRDRRPTKMLHGKHSGSDFIGFKTEDWHNEGGHDVVRVTARFADGREITREAKITYKRQEREQIVSAILQGGEPDRAIVKKADVLRKLRWSEKQRLFGEMQREFAKGLPA